MKKILALFALVLVITACQRPAYLPPPAQPVAFALPQHGGEGTWNSGDYKGKPVFIAAMASYCGYCKMSVPMVNKVYENYKDKGIEVIGVFANPANDAELDAYIREQGVLFPILGEGIDVFETLGVEGVPHFVLLNESHKPVKVWGGFSQNHNFEADIDKLLK